MCVKMYNNDVNNASSHKAIFPQKDLPVSV